MGRTLWMGHHRRGSAVRMPVVAVAGVVALVAAGMGSAHGASSRGFVRLGGAVEVPTTAHAVGLLPAPAPLQLDIALEPRDPAALVAFAGAVSDPSSSSYHRYLAPGQFAGTFGATTATVTSVDAVLRHMGLRPGPVSSNRLSIPVTTTAGVAARAFDTHFVRYRLVDGRSAYTNVLAPRVPASISGAVEGVIGLNSFVQNAVRPLPATRSGTHRDASADAAKLASSIGESADSPAISNTTCETNVQDGLYEDDGFNVWTAPDLATLYGFTGFYSASDKGAGQTVAILETDSDRQSDIATYEKCVGDTTTTVGYVAVDGGQGLGGAKASPGEGEAALDIEIVAGLAPTAKILVYQGRATGNFFTNTYDIYSAIIKADKAKVVSSSDGVCEAEVSKLDASGLSAENTLFEEAATQGQTVLAASGDSGASECSQVSAGDAALTVLDPASQPFVTGVGGTTLETPSGVAADPDGDGVGEGVWNNGEGSPSKPARDAAGGGISAHWKMPTYQSGAPSSLGVKNPHSSAKPCAASVDCRESPDVSASADPSWGYMIYHTDASDPSESGWGGFGGTSAATPLWAAMIALGNASTACQAGGALGFLNPALYKVGATDTAAFDNMNKGTYGDAVFPPTNSVTTPASGLFPVTTNGTYNMATGLGGPIATDSAKTGLMQKLCGIARTR